MELQKIVWKFPLRFFKMKMAHAPYGVQNNIPGVCSRSSPKYWMDSPVFGEWVNESAIFQTSSVCKTKNFFDNASGHRENERVK